MTSTRNAERRAAGAPAFRLVGGKGGVGKTTCAAAYALAAAREGRRTLLITTDPAPSLADALRHPLGDRTRRLRVGGAVLHARELDAHRAFERWLAGRRATVHAIATRGTWLDEADVAGLLRLALPGIDEIAALFELLSLARDGAFDVVVVDTAPTGHTLRLLALPGLIGRVAELFEAMQGKHRAVATALRGRWVPDEGDALVSELAEGAAELTRLLRERARTTWVTLPEAMAVSETADAAGGLARLGLSLGTLVVNRVTAPPPSRCSRCGTRRAYEGRIVDSLRRRLPEVPLRVVPAFEREPRGAAGLLAVARQLAAAPGAGRPARAAAGWRASPQGRPARAEDLAAGGTRLLMFGGKGGVGKTTCAAAAALAVATVRAPRSVLLVSTDPAHSLSDVFRAPVGDRPGPVAGGRPNLLVWELDAAARFDALRRRYAEAVEELFARIGRGAIDLSHDRRVLAGLFDIAPPGVDELVAVADVAERLSDTARGERDDELVVLDLAPTGHALRLLETPELVQDWLKMLMGMLLKYQVVTGIGALGSTLLAMSRSLTGLRGLLGDPTRCRVVVVTRAAALPVAETQRLMEDLDRMGLAVPALIANATGRGGCARCRAEAGRETRHVRALARMARAGGATLLVTPEVIPPPEGARALRRWATTWRVPPVYHPG